MDEDDESIIERIWLHIVPRDLTNNVKYVAEQHELCNGNPSPIDINVTASVKIDLPLLRWKNYEIMPKKMKITNTGETLILSAKWHNERPYVSGACLDGKYVFSQLHFHWGASAIEGSEHTIDGVRMPLEMHVIHFKAAYLNQNTALTHPDGVICMAYMFQIRSNHNLTMNPILSTLRDIRMANTATAIEPFILNTLLYPFEYDYYMYWGSADPTTTLLWFICRHVESISFEQLCSFRQLMDTSLRPITRNWRETNSTAGRVVMHVNAAYQHTNSTLSPVPLRLDPDRELMQRQRHIDTNDGNYRSMQWLKNQDQKN